jgi:hypothetical protein
MFPVIEQTMALPAVPLRLQCGLEAVCGDMSNGTLTASQARHLEHPFPAWLFAGIQDRQPQPP